MLSLAKVRPDPDFMSSCALITGGINCRTRRLQPVDNALIKLFQLERKQPFPTQVIKRHYRRHHVVATGFRQQ